MVVNTLKPKTGRGTTPVCTQGDGVGIGEPPHPVTGPHIWLLALVLGIYCVPTPDVEHVEEAPVESRGLPAFPPQRP